MLKGLFGKPVKAIVDSVGQVLDQTITSTEERVQALGKIERIIQDNVTSRHIADMTSDSWLSKNIRPLSLIFILVMYSFLSIADGNLGALEINEGYVTLLGDWGKLIFSFYFGARAVEKIFKMRRKAE